MAEDKFDYTGFYTIVLTQNSNDMYDTVSKILTDCWMKYIVNVNVIIAIPIYSRTIVYTYFPFTKFHCGIVQPVIVNIFENNTFLYDVEIFPNKMKNFYKCPITVALFESPPFMILKSFDNGTIFTDGFDGIIFRVLSQRLNFTPVIYFVPRNEQRGEIFENGTMTGGIKLVNMHYII